MLSGLIDVHSHLLPGIDDGCESAEESLACARQLVRAGYAASFCTPHFMSNFPDNSAEQIPQAVSLLQKQLDAEKIPLKLYPGAEINIRLEVELCPREQIPTYGMGAARYALVDIWCSELPDFFERVVRRLQSYGLTVVLAHPERMRAVQIDPKLAELFSELGLLLQGNLACFNDRLGTETRRIADLFLEQDRYFMLGSDLHRLDSLAERLGGLARVIEVAGEARVHQLMRDNPAKLLMP